MAHAMYKEFQYGSKSSYLTVKESLVDAVSRLLIHLLHVLESEFASGVKDVTFVLIYI